jgi:hypothetical protein
MHTRHHEKACKTSFKWKRIRRKAYDNVSCGVFVVVVVVVCHVSSFHRAAARMLYVFGSASLRFWRPKAGSRTKRPASHPASRASASARSGIPMVQEKRPPRRCLRKLVDFSSSQYKKKRPVTPPAQTCQ